MATVTFDTLKLAERLQSGGFTPEQSRVMSSALSDTVGDWLFSQQMATKDDLAAGLAATKADLTTKLAATTADLTTKLAETKADLIKWVVGISFAQIGLLFALLKLVAHAG